MTKILLFAVALIVACATPVFSQIQGVPTGVAPCRLSATAVTVCAYGPVDYFGAASPGGLAQTGTAQCVDQNGGTSLTGPVVDNIGAFAATNGVKTLPIPHRTTKGLVCQAAGTIITPGIDIYFRPVNPGGSVYPGQPQ